MNSKKKYDVIVIGSGFGGSIMSCRLSEKGYQVCLLERGKSYSFNDFPRRFPEFKTALWDPKENLFGLYEFLNHPESEIATVTASGLGGGSLVYSAVHEPMNEEAFSKGWPKNINRKSLEPYYKKVLEMMESSPFPIEKPFYKDTPKASLLKNSIDKIKKSGQMRSNPKGFFPDLGIRFKGDFPGHQSLNSHNVLQASCTSCGECSLGCNIMAKNSLDLNYLAVAKNQTNSTNITGSTDIITLAQVFDIIPQCNGGFKVLYKDYKENGINREIYAKRVVVSCGSIGSSGLLLSLKKKGSLPYLSDQLGKKWCANGDFEATILNLPKSALPSKGPVITYAIEFTFKPYPDDFYHSLILEDGGLPPIVSWYISGKIPSVNLFIQLLKSVWDYISRLFKGKPDINLGDDIYKLVKSDNLLDRSMIILGMGRDRSTGEVKLTKGGDIYVKWEAQKNAIHIERAHEAAESLAKAMGGKLVMNPLSWFGKHITVHSLGSCVMGESEESGVVNEYGEVFNHNGLYVVDGSILPTSTGPNPSLTIGALAERIAEKF